MSSKSIFSNIVQKEDAFTQLLCDLMRRDRAFRCRVLSLLFPGWSEDVQPGELYTQADHQKDGRPDLVICTKTAYAIVEIKVSDKRGITPNQDIDIVADEKGYLKALREILPGKKTYLTFLVPQKWKYFARFENNGLSIRQQGIEFNITTWQRLLSEMESDFRQPLFEEFRLLLIENFLATSFTQKEADTMFDKSFSLSAVRKLERVINIVAKRAEQHTGYILQKPNVEKDDEYDFYLSKQKEKEYVFYFGYWEKFAETRGRPICFGVENDPKLWVPGLKKALMEANPETEEVETYTLASISKEDLYTADAVERIWEKIRPTLDGIRAFAGK